MHTYINTLHTLQEKTYDFFAKFSPHKALNVFSAEWASSTFGMISKKQMKYLSLTFKEELIYLLYTVCLKSTDYIHVASF